MLDKEQAGEELERIKDPQWAETRMAAAAGRPERIWETARLLLDSGGHPAQLRQGGQSKEFKQALLAMDETARNDFFELLLPGLGEAVARGWKLFERLPYQTRYERKPFRAPGHANLLINRRSLWLQQLLMVVGPYPGKDVRWLAAWTPHLARYTGADGLGILFAASIDAGGPEGEEVLQVMLASGRNEYEIGAMGRHVTTGLLCAGRVEGWEFIERMLLAAQREEGLRQTILETVDEAHPQAFRRMLRLILDQNLVRFSATVRALDVWLGYAWDAVSAGVVQKTIERILVYLENAAARKSALAGNEAEDAYLALWSSAFDNGVATMAPAGELLKHANAEHRFAAAHLLGQLGLYGSQKSLIAALEDADLRVAARALIEFSGPVDSRVDRAQLFAHLQNLLPRAPVKAEKLKPAIWPWMTLQISQESVANVLSKHLGQRPPTALIPHLPRMGTHERMAVVNKLAAQEQWDTPTRDTLFALLGDSSRHVREGALVHLAKCNVTTSEAQAMELLLERKTSDLRRAVLTLLARQSDADVLASADRLLADKSQPRRLAGLELLRQLVEAKRCQEEARQRAQDYSTAHPTLNDAERRQIEATLTAQDAEAPTLANALGLISHDERTWPQAPVLSEVCLHSPSSPLILAAIEKLLEDHAQDVVSYRDYMGQTRQAILADVHVTSFLRMELEPGKIDETSFPLGEVWRQWWETRGPELRDADGMELLRALAWSFFFWGYVHSCAPRMYQDWPEITTAVFGPQPKVEPVIPGKAGAVLAWLLKPRVSEPMVKFALDGVESCLALTRSDVLRNTPEQAMQIAKLNASAKSLESLQELKNLTRHATWRENGSAYHVWERVAQAVFACAPRLWTQESNARYWRLLRWADEPLRAAECGGHPDLPKKTCLPRGRAAFERACRAFGPGGATRADLIEGLLGDRELNQFYPRHRFDDLRMVSRRKPTAKYAAFAFLPAIVEECRRRILELELTRGDTPTAASTAALCLASVEGVENLFRVLRALGNRPFARGWVRDSQGPDAVFSHLARSCFPAGSETAADFARLAREAKIGEERLVELAVYAPQWARWVEEALGWKLLADAVWWIHAHTKGSDWTVEKEIREIWEADMSARTVLSATDLVDGAVDVAWFLRVYKALGAKRWNVLHEAASLASSGAGHARARVFADAMSGGVSKKELTRRITEKRHQDSVRSLGLLPLAAGPRKEADVLSRYKVIQEFRRGSKQFGSQRQASEKRAAQIAMQNLARTAGYADPIRLEWAMEARAVEDVADGPIELTIDDAAFSLGIDPFGEIEFSVTKGGKTLADVPASLKKDARVKALRERKVELKRQALRIRPSLEQFMTRGEHFTGAELRELMRHPLLAPMLRNLVLIGEGIAGYPAHEGKALEDHAGAVEAIKAGEKLRVAHPLDLLPATQWHRWQKDCFARERIQPFKQVFRELYTVTAAEKEDGLMSRRYAGHQVQPRQALALLGQRGWVAHPEEGVFKTFHEAGLVASLGFEEGFFTPAEIEGLTLEGVVFTRRENGETVKLTNVPPLLFSEAMRDLDLAVSVAHRGGVDPEASASTIEMRASLVTETAKLLRLDNVRIKDRYVLIDGKLGSYAVHLGSAVTRKMPGEALFIVAVHGQHRGRLFLPFADDDPRTAEVMSKTLLLARDLEIKDPTILDQLR